MLYESMLMLKLMQMRIHPCITVVVTDLRIQTAVDVKEKRCLSITTVQQTHAPSTTWGGCWQWHGRRMSNGMVNRSGCNEQNRKDIVFTDQIV